MEFEWSDRMNGLRTVYIASNEPVQAFERTVWTIGRPVWEGGRGIHPRTGEVRFYFDKGILGR